MGRNSRSLCALLASTCLVLSVAACTSSSSDPSAGGSGSSPTTPANEPGSSTSATSSPVKPRKPLQFRAVRTVTQGTCPSDDKATVEDRTLHSCLHLGKPAMTVRSLTSVEAVSDPQWTVTITLQPDDARRFSALTQTVSTRPAPRNEVAVVLGAPQHRRLLTAPTVQQAIHGGALQISGGFTEKSATQLAHDLGA